MEISLSSRVAVSQRLGVVLPWLTLRLATAKLFIQFNLNQIGSHEYAIIKAFLAFLVRCNLNSSMGECCGGAEKGWITSIAFASDAGPGHTLQQCQARLSAQWVA